MVWKFDRLARSLRHLIRLGRELGERGCQLVSLTEGIDTTTPGCRLVYAVFGALAEFETDLVRERTKAAHGAARAAGRTWGRPSPFHDPENVRVAKAMLADPALTLADVARHFGVRPKTVRRWFPRGDPDAFTGFQQRAPYPGHPPERKAA